MIRLALVLALVAGQVQALSCMRPEVKTSYAAAAALPEPYVIVAGTLRFDPRRMPKPLQSSSSAAPKPVKAYVDGLAMSRKGFDTTFKTPVTLEVSCAGAWCGSLAAEQDYLMFLRHDEDGYALEVGPCPWFAFSEDLEAAKRAAYGCFKSGRC